MSSREESIGDIRQAYAGRLFPHEQIPTFRHIDRAFPSRVIPRGGPVRPLTESRRDIRDIRFQSGGRSFDLFDYVSQNRITGLLVLKDGERVLEHYDFGNDPDTRWMSMSMAKSVSTTLVGVALAQGLIRSLDDPLTDYIPALAGGTYGDVSVRHLLLMASGADWNEDQTAPDSERRQVLELQIGQQPGSILRFMSALPKLAPSGTRWNYSTGETHLVGELLRAATGQWLSDYLSEQLWQPLGMEADASWWLEAPDGLEIAGSGIAATLRDYGRFGQFICDNGTIDGRQVLTADWVQQASGPTELNGGTIPYGYMWWSVPGADGDHRERAFSARGIFGQRIYINRPQRVVIVEWCARSKPMGDEPISDNAFFNAACSALA